MSKYLLLIVVILVMGGGLGIVAFKIRNPSVTSFPAASELTADNESSMKGPEMTYADESGFSFKYPGNLRVSDITPNDNAYYSLVDVRLGDKSLRVSIKDGSFTVPTDAALVGAVTLGGISAKQYTYKSNSETVLATVGVQGGIVYLIEGPKDGGFWEDTQNMIASSFNIGDESPSTSLGTTSSTIDEGEEIVE